jgi:DNA-binding transcriptional ArsR family regulator
MDKSGAKPWYVEGRALDARQEKVFIFLSEKGPRTVGSIAKETSVSHRSITGTLRSLIKKKLVQYVYRFDKPGRSLWLTPDGVILAMLYGVEASVLIGNMKKEEMLSAIGLFSGHGELEVLSILGDDVLKVARSLLRLSPYSDAFVPAFISGILSRSDYSLPEKWSKIEEKLHDPENTEIYYEDRVLQIDKALFALQKLRRSMTTKAASSYEGTGDIGELIEKADKAFSRNSLEKLHEYQAYLDEIYKRRIKSEKNPTKVFFLAALRSMVDTEIARATRTSRTRS